MPKLELPEIVHLILESLRDEAVAIPSSTDECLALRLIGEGAALKSVGLVAVLVGIEQRLAEFHGIEISLMDERAMSQTRSPFRSVGSLADYIRQLVAEHKP